MEFEVFIDKWEGNIDKGISCPLNENNIEKYLRTLDGSNHKVFLKTRDDKI